MVCPNERRHFQKTTTMTKRTRKLVAGGGKYGAFLGKGGLTRHGGSWSRRCAKARSGRNLESSYWRADQPGARRVEVEFQLKARRGRAWAEGRGLDSRGISGLEDRYMQGPRGPPADDVISTQGSSRGFSRHSRYENILSCSFFFWRSG